ncbi:hypothetical protein Tco_0925278, partial [Tanacetum coccineum]
MPTEMELTLEQTQQGVSYEVSNIRVISFTMKMEILLEPTSNKLMVGVVPPKIARKFKKASPSKKDSDLVHVDKEPVQKGKRVKRPAKKSTTTPAVGIIIREAPVETKSKRNVKEKVDVAHGKGIELLFDVAFGLRIESWGNDEDDDNNEQESSNESSEQENESDDDETQSDSVKGLDTENENVIKSDEEKGMDDTTYQFNDNVDARLKEPTQTDKEVVQGEGADAEMNDAQQGNENLETTQEQVLTHVETIFYCYKGMNEVPVTILLIHPILAYQFLYFLDISHCLRRADNVLYRFKEGDFPRLWINDIEDMLLLVVQNRLTNLLGDDVADFAIALRMFTKSLKKSPRTLLTKQPQGIIYVDNFKRNKLMRSDELYKFSDGTLTRLLSSLEDITKNIDMYYLPKRRWSTLENKRAHFMIKDINKQLKEDEEEFREIYSHGSLVEAMNNPPYHSEHAKFDESDTYLLERFDTSAGNPIKEILLRLNLLDHRSILTDSK